MPSPVVHLCAGALTYGGLKARWREANPLRRVVYLFALLFFSMLPDLDSVAGIVLDDMLRYHNNILHSFGFALIAGGIAWCVAPLFGEKDRRFWALLVCGSCAGHVLLDCFTHGRGVMLLWPLTDMRIQPPYQIFYGLRWSEGLLSKEHLFTAGTEAAMVLVSLCFISLVRRVRRSLR